MIGTDLHTSLYVGFDPMMVYTDGNILFFMERTHLYFETWPIYVNFICVGFEFMPMRQDGYALRQQCEVIVAIMDVTLWHFLRSMLKDQIAPSQTFLQLITPFMQRFEHRCVLPDIDSFCKRRMTVYGIYKLLRHSLELIGEA